ncbi:hypothetical protein LZ906_006560 [Paraclostridium ghonii]|nr:hypothetical protein [Paeniclostridium ghonii]
MEKNFNEAEILENLRKLYLKSKSNLKEFEKKAREVIKEPN